MTGGYPRAPPTAGPGRVLAARGGALVITGTLNLNGRGPRRVRGVEVLRLRGELEDRLRGPAQRCRTAGLLGGTPSG